MVTTSWAWKALRALVVMWTVLLGGCAASGPGRRPEAPPSRPAVWLLDVQDAPVALLEVARPSRSDRVEVKSQGSRVHVALRFAHGVRVTPLVRMVGGEKTVLLRSEDVGTRRGANHGVAKAAREERYEEAQRTLEDAAEWARDDISVEVVESLSEEALKRMARSHEGNLLLESLFDAMTSGHVTTEEMEQAARLLAVEAQRRYPTPEDFVRAVGRGRVFPFEAMGLTKGGAPLMAGRRGDGKIWVNLTPRSFENKYRAEAATLYGLEYVLEPDELVGVKLYDEGGRVVYVPALYLLLLSHEDSARVGWKMVEAGVLGLSLGAGVLVEAGVEAGAAARVLVACDRVAVAMGIATSLLLEHRGWLVERFGDEGRGIVYGLEVFHSALAVYGVVRLGMAAPSLVRGVRELYQGFLKRAQAQSQLGKLTREESVRVARLQQQMEGVFQELEAMQDVGGVTSPAGVGAKIIPLDRARSGRGQSGASMQVRAVDEEMPLAATGTDARLLPIERQGATEAEAPVASLSRRGASGGSTTSVSSVSSMMGETGSGNPRAPRSANQGPARARPAPSKYRLEKVEEWRKPQFTEDGQVLPYKDTRNPPEPITVLGRDRAGQVITDGEVSVRFDKNGFAEFDAQFETVLDDIHIGSGRPDLHFKAANKRLYDAIQEDPGLAAGFGLSAEDVARLPAMRRPPDGYTWHHHQDVGRMQLVRSQLHDLAKPHTGGMAIWGGGYARAAPKTVPK